MKILKVNTYRNTTKKHWRVFFIGAVTFKRSRQGLFKSHVPSDYYTTELTKIIKP